MASWTQEEFCQCDRNPGRKKKKKDRDLRCRICGQICPCLIYGKPVEHAHAPGGLLEYPVCYTHQEECIKIHRRREPDGTWKWGPCNDSECGYCKAITEMKQRYGLTD